MSNKSPEPWTNLSPEQWKSVQRSDHTTLFTRGEVRTALKLLLVPVEEAEATLAELFDQPQPEPIFFFGDLLTALSLGSAGAAERVRTILNETEAQAAARIRHFLDSRRHGDESD